MQDTIQGGPKKVSNGHESSLNRILKPATKARFFIIFDYRINVKNVQFKTVCNGDTAYITQVKQQKTKTVLLLWQHIAIVCQRASK